MTHRLNSDPASLVIYDFVDSCLAHNIRLDSLMRLVASCWKAQFHYVTEAMFILDIFSRGSKIYLKYIFILDISKKMTCRGKLINNLEIL